MVPEELGRRHVVKRNRGRNASGEFHRRRDEEGRENGAPFATSYPRDSFFFFLSSSRSPLDSPADRGLENSALTPRRFALANPAEISTELNPELKFSEFTKRDGPIENVIYSQRSAVGV